MPEEDNNFGGSLDWILKNDNVTCNPRLETVIFIGKYNIFAVDNRECSLSYYLFHNKIQGKKIQYK